MAANTAPQANVQLKSFPYDNAQYTEHDFEQGLVGVPHISASGIASGNGAYPCFVAGAPGYIYGATVTVIVPGTGANSNIVFSLVRANNGANVSNTITFPNNIVTGVNTSGNTFGVSFSYNLYSNGVQSGSNTVTPGGIYVNVGDTLVGTHTGNTLCAAVSVEYSVAPGANVTA